MSPALADAPDTAVSGRRAPIAGRPIRVAHLIHTMAHGGVETALINWMRTFDRTRVEPHLLCFANPGGTERPFVDAARAASMQPTLIPWGRTKPIWRASRALAEYLRRERIDILHCHNTYANAVGVVARRMTGVKTLTTIYVWSGVGWKRRVLQSIDERLIRMFDQITAHCQAALRDTVARGFAADEVRLLTCGFDGRPVRVAPADRARLRAALGAADDEVVLIKVARFWPEKRHDVLLKGFQLLLQRVPKARLWLPGVGPERERMEAMANDLGLASRVHFLGFRDDLPELLALADIQVHTSDEEGVPLAILSGMAAGLPIVSTGVGGILEVLEDRKSGLLIAPRDPELFARTVADLIAAPALQAALGSAAQHFIESEYSLAAATARVETLYEEVISR